MKNNITELVFIIDRSGSMFGLEKDTIGGFNSLIEKQKKEEGTCLVSTVLFNNNSEVIHDRLPLDEISNMTEKEYSVSGSTALIDALGGAVKHISSVHRYIRPEDVPEHTLFVITTDGKENASRKYTADQVRKMVKEKEKEGWEFLFIGANIDSVEAAAHYGIKAENAVDYVCDSQGTAIVYETVCAAAGAVRNGKKLGRSWSSRISEDNRNRGR